MSHRPQRPGLGRRLWPRQRHFGHVNVQIVDKTGMKGPLTWPKRRWRGQRDAGVAKATLAWPKRRWRGQRDGGVAKETVAWPKRRWRGQRDGGVAKEYPVPNVTSWTGRIVAMRRCAARRPYPWLRPRWGGP